MLHSARISLAAFIGVFIFFGILGNLSAQSDTPLSAEDSDPRALGWIVSRVTNKSLSDLMSERIWSKMGAEQDGYMTVDSKGTPFAGGGLSAGLRDLGRIGLLMLNGGELNGQQLFPKSVVENIRSGGKKSAFAKAGYNTLKGGSYRGMWWIFHNKHGAFAARGVHGQTIYVDPTADIREFDEVKR